MCRQWDGGKGTDVVEILLCCMCDSGSKSWSLIWSGARTNGKPMQGGEEKTGKGQRRMTGLTEKRTQEKDCQQTTK